MSDRVVARNLIEISYAESPKDLVAIGSRLYHKSFGFGRIINFFYNAFPCLGSQEEKVNAVSQKTRENFFKSLEDLNKSEKYLQKGLKSLLLGEKIKTRGFNKARDRLLSFTYYLDPFVKEVRKGQGNKLLSFLTADASEKQEMEEIADEVQSLFFKIHFYQKIFKCQQATKAKIPFFLLHKMSLDWRLKASEEDVLQKWLRQLRVEENQTLPSLYGRVRNVYVQTRQMHRLLHSIVEFIREKLPRMDEMYAAALECLEANLIASGYQIFEDLDPKHIKWRRTLAPGQKISEEYTLGVRIRHDIDDRDAVVFSIQGHPDKEVVLYYNEAMSYIMRFDESILHCGIRQPKIYGISEFGRIIVRERLYDSLADNEWNTTNLDVMREQASPIVELLRGFKDLPFTPVVGEEVDGFGMAATLHPEHFAFNANNELKAATCFVPGHYSFDTLENFAYECAKGNSLVFQYIMHASGLKEKDQARGYRILFKAALEDKDEFKYVTKNSSLTNQVEKQNRQLFYRRVRKQFRDLCAKLEARITIDDYVSFKNTLIQELVKLQEKHCPGGILFDEIFDMAGENILSKMNEKKSKRRSTRAK